MVNRNLKIDKSRKNKNRGNINKMPAYSMEKTVGLKKLKKNKVKNTNFHQMNICLRVQATVENQSEKPNVKIQKKSQTKKTCSKLSWFV